MLRDRGISRLGPHESRFVFVAQQGPPRGVGWRVCFGRYILRRRAAYHEAAHAVLVVAIGCVHGETYLTKGTRLDGALGGWTGWSNPLDPRRNPAQPAFNCYADKVVMVLYAGQYAERVLSRRWPVVRVPKREPNWDHDDNEAAKLLAVLPLSGIADAESTLRKAARQEVVRFWWVVTRVARELLKPLQRDAVWTSPHRPEGHIIRQGDIQDLIRGWQARGEPKLGRPPWHILAAFLVAAVLAAVVAWLWR
jgi:hypothetical protein